MDATFSFDVVPARDLVRTQLAGFWTPDVFPAYLAARADAFTRLRCRVRDHLALTDITGMRIQSQDAVTEFTRVLGDPRTRAKRLAFVVATSLARSQLQRALGNRDAACFDTLAEAERWLLNGEQARAA